MSEWGPLLSLLLIIAVGVAFLAFVRWLRVRQLSRVSIPEPSQLERASAELLEYVKQKSYEPGRVVELRPFWKGRHLGSADRYAIQMPLHESEVLLVMKPTGGAEKVVDRIMEWTFLPLPERVVLNTQEWHRMVNGGVSSTTIIAERYDARTITTTNANYGSGNQVSVQAAGDQSAASASDIRFHQAGLSPHHLERLASALRTDAERLDGRERDLITALAKDFDSARHDPGQSDIAGLIKRATTYAGLLSGGLAATSELIRSLKHLLPPGLID